MAVVASIGTILMIVADRQFKKGDDLILHFSSIAPITLLFGTYVYMYPGAISHINRSLRGRLIL